MKIACGLMAVLLCASVALAADSVPTSEPAAEATPVLRSLASDQATSPGSGEDLELIHPWDNPQRHDSTQARGPSSELRPVVDLPSSNALPETPAASATKSTIVPASLGPISNYPNPFNAQTRIAFRLAEAGPVTLTIFNLLGQTVENVDLGRLESGPHDWTWNGMLEGGRPAPSGVYFYRIATGTASAINKMVLLK